MQIPHTTDELTLKILYQFYVMILSNKGIRQTSTFFIDVQNVDCQNKTKEMYLSYTRSMTTKYGLLTVNHPHALFKSVGICTLHQSINHVLILYISLHGHVCSISRKPRPYESRVRCIVLVTITTQHSIHTYVIQITRSIQALTTRVPFSI
jgi:hypothetical protein